MEVNMRQKFATILLLLALAIIACESSSIPGLSPATSNPAGTQAVSILTSMPDQIATQAAFMLTALPTPTLDETSKELQTPSLILVPTLEVTNIPPTATQETAQVPTATLPNDTVPATSTTAPTPTVVAADPKTYLGYPTWLDTFYDNYYWDLTPEKHTRYTIENGSLVMTALKPDNFDGWTLRAAFSYNYYVEATFRPGQCSGLDRYGLVFRAPDVKSGYLIGFSCDGKYSLRKWNGKEYTYVKSWTRSDHIYKGSSQTNRLGILVKNNTYSFYANGNLLTEITDYSYIGDRFGPFVASENTTNFATIVDEIAYWALP
jgi:hypothetical protein